MTLVVSWIKYDTPTMTPNVWTISDGKIMGGHNTLTLEGSKVFELHIRIKHLSGPAPREVYFRSSIGFAYAGSSLVGLNTFATLSDVVSNLGGDKDKNNLPSYTDIIEKAKIILKRYTTSINSPCEICLFGFCPKTKEPFISKIRPTANLKEISDVETIYGQTHALKYILLGDKTADVRTEISKYLNDYTPTQFQYWNIPQAVFCDILNKNTFETIGGGMQLAIAYNDEFQMTAIETISKDDNSKATISHKNFDIVADLGINVGDCIFAMDMMDIGLTQHIDKG